VIFSDLVETGVFVVEHESGEFHDEIGKLGLADTVAVVEAAALAFTVTVGDLVLSRVADQCRRHATVPCFRVTHRHITCITRKYDLISVESRHVCGRPANSRESLQPPSPREPTIQPAPIV